MNGNSYYITASFILYIIDSYYSLITIIAYQMCFNCVASIVLAKYIILRICNVCWEDIKKLTMLIEIGLDYHWWVVFAIE